MDVIFAHIYHLRCSITRSLPKSASFDETQTQTALDVVRTKRAKQLLNEKVTRQSSTMSGSARTTKSGLSGDYERERTVGCADMVAEKVRSKTPTPHHSRPTTPLMSNFWLAAAAASSFSKGVSGSDWKKETVLNVLKPLCFYMF